MLTPTLKCPAGTRTRIRIQVRTGSQAQAKAQAQAPSGSQGPIGPFGVLLGTTGPIVPSGHTIALRPYKAYRFKALRPIALGPQAYRFKA